MRTDDFDYALPEELIARAPAATRDGSRLMLVPGDAAAPFGHLAFRDLPGQLRPGDLLVLNDTRVLRARLLGRRIPGGGQAELLLLEPVGHDPSAPLDEALRWVCLARPGRKLGEGARIVLGEGFEAIIEEARSDGSRVVGFSIARGTLGEALERHGHPPLPPYILKARKHLEHDDAPERGDDAARYQTVFAQEGCSVAAPTAGLHFTPELLATLQARGVEIARLRLDVGAGTFKPVEAEDPREHPMHTEWFQISEATAQAVERARAEGRRIVAAGTTSLRALESAATLDDKGELRIAAGARATSILILPGYSFRAVDGLITNFHLPRSTLLMLVSAIAGRERMLAAYAEAIRERYRFYSFGDGSLLWRPGR